MRVTTDTIKVTDFLIREFVFNAEELEVRNMEKLSYGKKRSQKGEKK